MKTKTKNKILTFFVMLIASIVPALIFNKWIEAIVFFACHTLIRPQFKRQYHHIMPYICREITGIVFFFGTSFVLPMPISLISAIPINYIIGWIGDIKATSDYYEIKCNELQEKYCNKKEDLLVKCRKANLSKRDTEIAVKYFYEKQTPKEIWLWLCNHKEYEPIEWDSVYHLLWQLNKKLNKNSKIKDL